MTPSRKSGDKKKKEVTGPKRGIVDVLHCPPIGKFYYELVVGNGIGDDAVEDALEAFKRAWESRRQKAHEAANQDVERPARTARWRSIWSWAHSIVRRIGKSTPTPSR